MHPLLILLIGMIVVIAGIGYFRWHAFLSLIAAALAIALLTSPAALLRHGLSEVGLVLQAAHVADHSITAEAIGELKLLPQSYRVLRDALNHDPAESEFIGLVQLVIGAGDREGEVVVADSVALEPGDQLISTADWNRISSESQRSVGERVASGFGDTCRKIGILIAMAAIIGHCMLHSGGAQRIIQASCTLVGDSRASIAFVVSGFVLGIPVFFDTVFYLLIPLAKALYRRTRKDYLLYVMSIIVGATMAHSLVPPTPGPLLVASELKINLGVALKAGIVVGLICSLAGYLFSLASNRRWSVIPELEWDPDPASQDAQAGGGRDAGVEHAAALPDPGAAVVDPAISHRLPPLWLSLLPIVLPLVLLASGADWSALGDAGAGVPVVASAPWKDALLDFASDKNIALTLSAAVALVLLASSPQRDDVPLARHVHDALSDAGSIILITAAGGALGQVIRETGIAEFLVEMMPARGAGVLVLFVAFFVTMLIRFVQGSATVAMITAVGIVAPLASSMTLAFHPVYLFLAIGCGSKPLPWMNDSGFWVIGRLSGMTPQETLKSFSATLTVMGFVGFAVTVLGAVAWPMLDW